MGTRGEKKEGKPMTGPSVYNIVTYIRNRHIPNVVVLASTLRFVCRAYKAQKLENTESTSTES